MNTPKSHAARLRLAVFAVAIGALQVVGCRSALLDDDGKGDKPALLRPGLTVQVRVLVLGKAEVNEDNRRVSDEGDLLLPLVGDVPVSGMTLQDLEVELRERYRQYYKDPRVVVDYVVGSGEDAISPWGHVIVLGEVVRPGRVNIPPTRDLTVSAAIQQAGGLDTNAKDTKIRVTRTLASGRTVVLTVNLGALGDGNGRAAAKSDLLLRPGDIVRVPERFF